MGSGGGSALARRPRVGSYTGGHGLSKFFLERGAIHVKRQGRHLVWDKACGRGAFLGRAGWGGEGAVRVRAEGMGERFG